MEYAYFYMYTAVVKCATNGINRYLGPQLQFEAVN